MPGSPTCPSGRVDEPHVLPIKRHPAVLDKDPGIETGGFRITPAFARELSRLRFIITMLATCTMGLSKDLCFAVSVGLAVYDGLTILDRLVAPSRGRRQYTRRVVM